jgi:hypothetical protein
MNTNKMIDKRRTPGNTQGRDIAHDRDASSPVRQAFVL